MTAKHIAFFGRPGVGTTTVVANIAAALAESGRQVAVIGCPAGKHTTATLRQGEGRTDLLEALRQTPRIELGQVAATGFKGILCVELGKVVEEVEAAMGLTVIGELLASRAPQVDYVLYNATGADGEPENFVAPLLHNRQIDQLVAVSTADAAALQTVNRLLQLVQIIDKNHWVNAGGIIGNNLPGPHAEAIIDSFARATDIPVASFIPQSLVVTRSAFFGANVIDAAPLAHHAYLYRKAARALVAARPFSQQYRPRPFDEERFTEWTLDWGERLFDLGEGLVGSGGGI